MEASSLHTLITDILDHFDDNYQTVGSLQLILLIFETAPVDELSKYDNNITKISKFIKDCGGNEHNIRELTHRQSKKIVNLLKELKEKIDSKDGKDIDNIKDIKDIKYSNNSNTSTDDPMISIFYDFIFELGDARSDNVLSTCIINYNQKFNTYMYKHFDLIVDIKKCLNDNGWDWCYMKFTDIPDKEKMVSELENIIWSTLDIPSDDFNVITNNNIDKIPKSTSKKTVIVNNNNNNNNNNNYYNNEDIEFLEMYFNSDNTQKSRKSTNVKNVKNTDAINSVNKLITKLRNSSQNNELEIITYIHDYYYEIISCDTSQLLLDIRKCLEKYGWDWENMGWCTWPNLQNVICDMECIVERYTGGNKNVVKIDNTKLITDINSLISCIRVYNNTAVAKYYTVLSSESYKGNVICEKILKCLTDYSWMQDKEHFYRPVDRPKLADEIKFIIKDINNITDIINKDVKYINTNINYNDSAEVKLHKTILSTTKNLIDSIKLFDNMAIAYYYETYASGQYHNNIICLKVRECLTNYGWGSVKKEFYGAVDRTMLISDIEKIIHEHNVINDNDVLAKAIRQLIIDLKDNKVTAVQDYYKIVVENEVATDTRAVDIRECVDNYGFDWGTFTFRKKINTDALITDINTVLEFRNVGKAKTDIPYIPKNNFSTYRTHGATSKPKLDPEDPILFPVYTLMSDLRSDGLDSSLNTYVLEYYQIIEDNSFMNEEIIVELNSCLKNHKWNWDKLKGVRGFYTAPNKNKLIEDLQTIIDKYV
jgi:hypothetical protein